MGFRVDYETLAEHGAALSALHAEFATAEDAMADAAAALGCDELATELGRFASNWSDKRDEIAARLGGLAELATWAATVYADTELRLATTMLGAALGYASPVVALAPRLSIPGPGGAAGGPQVTSVGAQA
jgi:hypothetical protein